MSSALTHPTRQRPWLGYLFAVALVLLWSGFSLSGRHAALGTGVLLPSTLDRAPAGEIAFQALFQGLMATVVSLIWGAAVRDAGGEPAVRRVERGRAV